VNDKSLLGEAIALSEKSISVGGFPVGAIVVVDNKIVSRGLSNGKQLKDATSHGEIAAIREAEQILGTRDLKGATVYSSLEPCLMCFAACYWAGITKVVFACRKEVVSRMHYEGLHDLTEINRKNNRQIEISHVPELEEEALYVIECWERNLPLKNKVI
jgi:guanine deaminase